MSFFVLYFCNVWYNLMTMSCSLYLSLSLSLSCSLTYSCDGHHLYTANSEGTVMAWCRRDQQRMKLPMFYSFLSSYAAGWQRGVWRLRLSAGGAPLSFSFFSCSLFPLRGALVSMASTSLNPPWLLSKAIASWANTTPSIQRWLILNSIICI